MHRIRTWAHQKAHGPEPLVAESRRAAATRTRPNQAPRTTSNSSRPGDDTVNAPVIQNDAVEVSVAENVGEKPPTAKPGVSVRFFVTAKDILCSSIINVLLVFIPIGIAAHFANLSAGIIFAMNAIAIIPLAGLLSHATESVAKRMGDTIGALMNVTFGNAVELIIFIALVKNEIRIVQASLVGSILANLLLILGMCFLLGGLRYREQTAFHASFSNTAKADIKVVKVSRGTSVVLLLVYLLYLVFQLNSHAYMYESTPLETIQRESLPGPAAGYFNSSSSSESSSSSSDSDSDQSQGTARRIKRVIKKGRNKIHMRSASTDESATSPISPTPIVPLGETAAEPFSSITDESQHPTADVDVADDEGDNEPEKTTRHKRKLKHKKEKRNTAKPIPDTIISSTSTNPPTNESQVRRVDFALGPNTEAQTEPRSKPFSLLTLASPSTLSKTLSVTVFSSQPQGEDGVQDLSTANTSHARTAIPQPHLRRTASYPADNRSHNAGPGSFPPIVPIIVNRTPKTVLAGEEGEEEEDISRTTAVVLLLVSTGLVALCAEFMVGSIDDLVSDESGLSEAFIGLIILPIVGNAAEHVTGVTVAMRNKMDLAMSVALGSSIQIALFVTPIVVILGWILDKDMSLYFTLFETVSMFVSAFIVNFLVLDGRSNYLEGALLCAAYVIIAVVSFFYPNSDAANALGGGS
ncbi:sodium/calcium exchanger protein [Grosmannia clavigera kw1407]|uniref:Sodium/calcium exchanger protein n=1 Tax=Grosmannia clavigera (strain kw1407 / UAMH 11150) TaxID=655863 RepID=F0XQS0_GROCL|nr:sodium/calcium exchanger protein [Grosmannia clavigera kw1407]EFW99998.1 sodium/calcium exchanger protein [Grosmannia clavigera kw1407]